MGRIDQKRTSPKRERGFLLLVVISLLAVLLTICVGFLSFTRGEVQAVNEQRNKGDVVNLVQSAIDWSAATICSDTMDSSDHLDSKKPVSFTANGPVNWWYRPNEQGLLNMCISKWLYKGWTYNRPFNHMTAPTTEAQWVYLPPDTIPGGGLYARFMVQIVDTNAFLNINDWNDDCMPTQAQVSHMVMDGYGMGMYTGWQTYLEQTRERRDVGGGSASPLCPLRYDEAWRAATRTTRYLDWTYGHGEPVDNIVSYNWTTTNSTWMSMFGPDMSCIHSVIPSSGAFPAASLYYPYHPASYLYKGSQNYYPVDPPDTGGNPRAVAGLGVANQNTYMTGFVTQAYTDPDTGRSPINVNTCYNCGEFLPMGYYYDYSYGPNAFTMESVWNIESLRRIVKVGWFWSTSAVPPQWKHAQAEWPSLSNAEKMQVEQYKTKLAYQYQETLCRYFTASYNHYFELKKFPQYYPNTLLHGGAPYGPYIPADPGTYTGVYGTDVNFPVKHACPVSDYSKTRFNTDLNTFRQWCSDDLYAMAQNNINPSFVAPAPAPTLPPALPSMFGPDKTDGCVSFDKTGIPQIKQGKLDMRTAAACYDNLVPGKPRDITRFANCRPYTDANAASAAGADGCGDPLYELWKLGVSRMEDIDDLYAIDPGYKYLDSSVSHYANNNTQGWWGDNPQLLMATRWAGAFPAGGEVAMNDHFGNAMSINAKGKDYCASAYDPRNAASFNKNSASTFYPTLASGFNPRDPAGPWLDFLTQSSSLPGTLPALPLKIAERQRVFSPDCFSTELTTTTTTYLLIINAQLVDADSVRANPTNFDLHRPVVWNQWGVCIELAPGVEKDTDVTIAAATKAQNPYWDYYKNEMPMSRKTARLWDPVANAMDASSDSNNPDPNNGGAAQPRYLASMDFNCTFLKSRNYDEVGTRLQNEWGMQRNSTDTYLAPPNVSGKPFDPQNTNLTAITDWSGPDASNPNSRGCDLHQEPPTGDPSGRTPGVIYNGATQTQKRVLVRSIWCLNQGNQQ